MSPVKHPSSKPRGFYGVAVWQPKVKKNVGSLFRTAQVYEASFLATVGARYQPQASDTMKATRHVPLHHYSDIDDLIEHLPHGCRVIGVELDGRAVDLDVYQHPLSGLYLLGAEDHGLPRRVLDRCHEMVSIPSPMPQSLNVAVAGSIVVTHRYMAHRDRLRALEVAS